MFVIELVFLRISYCLNNVSSEKENALSRNLVFNKNNAFNANKLARRSDPFLLDIEMEKNTMTALVRISKWPYLKSYKGDEDFVILIKGNKFIQYVGYKVERRINHVIFSRD